MQVTRITQYYSRRFRAAMQIYRAEFPDTAFSTSRTRALLKAGSYQLFVAEDESGVPAMALVWICRQPAFLHLDYIAVKQEQKGRGIGTTLYRWLIDHIQELSPRAQLLTLEVDDELLGFYRRSATKVLQNTPYLFPACQGPLPLNLMVHDRLGRKTLNRALVQAIIRNLYRGIHNRGADDALLRSFITQVPRQVVLD
jgi:ribosomal protein S18 acetylase RimI-like enzyme